MEMAIKLGIAGLIAVLASFLVSPAALAQRCVETPETHAHAITALDSVSLPEIAGNSSFYQGLDNGWTFALIRAPLGWSIRLYDSNDTANATDLTSLTPPHGSVPNPRDIFGWHFRNAANTGPNEGDVNAPQYVRAFVISPGLAGTGGYKPSTDPDELRLQAPSPDDGIGWVRIEAMGLGNLNPGEMATMNYLQFTACVNWPKSDAEQIAAADAASLEFNVLDTGLFGACGLSTAYELNAQFLPRRQNLDIDGDGTTDVVAQIVRKSDGARGLALCRNAGEISIFGFDAGDAGNGLRSGFVAQTETWQWLAPGSEMPRHLTSHKLPTSDAGHLILERIEKEAIVVFWRDGRLDSEQLYRFVEP